MHPHGGRKRVDAKSVRLVDCRTLSELYSKIVHYAATIIAKGPLLLHHLGIRQSYHNMQFIVYQCTFIVIFGK